MINTPREDYSACQRIVIKNQVLGKNEFSSKQQPTPTWQTLKMVNAQCQDERNRIGGLDAKVEQSRRIFEVELTENEADALENFLKHITSNDFRVKTKNANEAYMMANATQKLRKAIVNKKSARH